MELINFLSFGTWDTFLVPNQIGIITGLTIALTVMFVIKFIATSIEILSNLSGYASGSFSGILITVFSTFFYVSLYSIPVFIAAIIGSYTLLLVTFWGLMAFFIASGFYFVVEDGKNLFKVDHYVGKLLESYMIYPTANYFANKKAVAKINKRIYEYRKNSI